MKYFIISIFLLVLVTSSNSQWILEHQFDGNFLQYVTIVDTGVVWAVGMSNQNPDSPFVALRTPSGWRYTSTNGLPLQLFVCTCIGAKDSMNAWIGTNDGKVYRTTNAGNNWQIQINAGGGYTNDIQFSRINPAYGYVFCDPPGGAGTPFKIYKTTDSGANWITYSPLLDPNMLGYDRSSSVTDSNHAWFGLYCDIANCTVTKIAYTTNGGNNWNTTTLPGSNGYYATDVEFQNNNIFGLAASNNTPTYIYKTTNNGSNWSITYTLPNPGHIENLVWVKGTSNWYYNVFDWIGKSTNNGTSWTVMTDPHGSDQINYIDAISQNNVVYSWAVTNGAKIMKLIDTVASIGINNISTEIPKAFKLSQNYPNPFNPTTKIRFDIPKSSFINVIIYNILGEEAAVPVNEELNSGTYEVDFDGSNLPSGTYFYRLQAGDFIETKKMVLLK